MKWDTGRAEGHMILRAGAVSLHFLPAKTQ